MYNRSKKINRLIIPSELRKKFSSPLLIDRSVINTPIHTPSKVLKLQDGTKIICLILLSIEYERAKDHVDSNTLFSKLN